MPAMTMRPRQSFGFFTRRSPLIDLAEFVLLAGALLWLALHGAQSMGYRWQWYRVPQYLARVIDSEVVPGPLLRGLVVTLEVSLWALLLTLVIGLVTALLRLSDSISGRLLARAYLEVIRNTPLLVQLYLFYFVLAPILGIGRFWTGILCLAFFEGSFAAEIIRAGILSVPKGQWEAADSLGLRAITKYRLVVLPQALQLMLPPLTGLAVSLIKNSSIVSVIAVFDLTNEGRNVIADTFMSFEIWFTVAAIYLLFTVSLSSLVGWLEHRLKKRQ
ncbi:MAG: amino acid ABC transporter permease [Proteobacteria bacterium]|nr:amino acid ABC transporter permease [Pseudomonadota bacterium]